MNYVAAIAATTLAGLALGFASSRASSPKCTRWGPVKSPLPRAVIERAAKLLSNPMGWKSDAERWSGRVFQFRVEVHGGDPQIPDAHKGVTVYECQD